MFLERPDPASEPYHAAIEDQLLLGVCALQRLFGLLTLGNVLEVPDRAAPGIDRLYGGASHPGPEEAAVAPAKHGLGGKDFAAGDG
jgi:hypothetical protein